MITQEDVIFKIKRSISNTFKKVIFVEKEEEISQSLDEEEAKKLGIFAAWQEFTQKFKRKNQYEWFFVADEVDPIQERPDNRPRRIFYKANARNGNFVKMLEIA
jgi:hypothetical protein